MTYGELKNLTSVFLIGDNVLPKEEGKIQAAVNAAYTFAANKCTALKLLTSNKDNAIMRMGPGNSYVRMPDLPVEDTDILDIDTELGTAIARIMAHFMAKEINMKNYHEVKALEIMRDYEGKVQEYIEEMKNRGTYEDVGESI